MQDRTHNTNFALRPMIQRLVELLRFEVSQNLIQIFFVKLISKRLQLESFFLNFWQVLAHCAVVAVWYLLQKKQKKTTSYSCRRRVCGHVCGPQKSSCGHLLCSSWPWPLPASLQGQLCPQTKRLLRFYSRENFVFSVKNQNGRRKPVFRQ